MRKIEATEKQVLEIIKLYTKENFGLKKIAFQIFGKITPSIIKRVLKKNNIPIEKEGQRYKGGKKASYKRNYHKHKNKKNEYHKEWSKNNRPSLRNYHKEWREENRDSVNSQKREKAKFLRDTDPFFRLNQNFKTALYTSLKEQNVSKNKHTFDLLGYTLEELIKHLEAQFQKGMTWGNYGKWHVDHKLPISSFIFLSTEDEEFKKCWGLKNLQPLWANENLSKGNKIIY